MGRLVCLGCFVLAVVLVATSGNGDRQFEVQAAGLFFLLAVLVGIPWWVVDHRRSKRV